MQKVFNVKTDTIKKCRTIKAIPMPQDVIKTVHDWARRSAHDEYKNKLVFLNRKKQRYEWDNDDLEEDNDLPEPAHPLIPAVLPGIDLVTDQVGHDDVIEVVEESDTERATAVLNNSGIIPWDNARTAGVATLVDEAPNQLGVPPHWENYQLMMHRSVILQS